MDDAGPPVERTDPGDTSASLSASPAAPSPGPAKRRPRPYAGAHVGGHVPERTPAHARKRDPIAEFFARTDEDEGRRWFRRSRKQTTAEPAEQSVKPAGKHSDSGARSVRGDLPRYARRIVKLAVVVALAVVAALLLRSYVVAPYYVPSQSMEPTLHGCPHCNDDHVLVEKLSYHFHAPQPGDIVVFNRPPNWHVSDAVLIKRVIGVAGDRITLRHGHVYRNGQRLDEPYVNPQCKQGTTTKDGSTRAHRYPRVKQGEVFVMGDNRCDSADSRFFGDVPTNDIIGRAFLIIWPLKRISTLN